MLKAIKITNFALLERVELDFEQGMTAITGESGSGKSLLLDAISSVLGARCNTQNIRQGGEYYTIEAIVDISQNPTARHWLEENGIDYDSDEIILRKQLKKDGRSRVQIESSLVPLGLLREFGNLIAEVHRQNDQLFLLNKDTQLKILDSFADVDVLKKEVSETYRTYASLKKTIKDLEKNTETKRQRVDFLKYQLEEIEKANLSPGEEARLLAEEKQLNQAEKLTENFSLLLSLFDSNEESILKQMAWALHSVDKIASLNTGFQTIADELRDTYEALKDISYRIHSNSQDDMLYSHERFDEVQRRLSELQRLKKKFGMEIDDILQNKERIERELQNLSGSGERLASLQQELMNIAGHLSSLAIQLSKVRRDRALQLEEKLAKTLQELGMKGAKLQIVLRWEPNEDGAVQERGKSYFVNENGLDQVEFYFSANPGEKPRPLRKIASGGELSRIMLAIKSIIQTEKTNQFMVFDEIDSGISGQTGNHLAKMLEKLAQKNQILLITHLQQIAARSNSHVLVDKKQKNGRTFSEVATLDSEKRARALARMISGYRVTRGALEHARELLVKKVG